MSTRCPTAQDVGHDTGALPLLRSSRWLIARKGTSAARSNWSTPWGASLITVPG